MNYKQILRNVASKAFVLLAVGGLGLAAASCTPEEEGLVDLSVSLSEVSVSDKSAVVNISLQNAQACYVGYVAKGQTEPTAEEIIASGNEVAVAGGDTQILNLTPNTTYVVLAVATAGKQSEMARLELTTLPFDATGALELNMVLEAVYSWGSSGGGNYQIVIANTSELGWEGDAQMRLDFYNDLDADPLNAVLPSGTYEATTDKAPFTYNPEYTYVTIVRNGELFSSPLVGTIIVSRNGGTYSILAEGTLLVDQTEIKVSYTGPIQFVESKTADWTKFDEAQNITFEQAQGRYSGGWFYPFADDLWLELIQGELNEENTLVNGYYIQISNLYIPKRADYNEAVVELPNGTYTIVDPDDYYYIASYAQPYTFDYGYEMDFYGTILHVGAYVTYVNQEENIGKIGYITGGTIEVSGSGDNYNLVFDLVTEEGVSIKGTYNGALNIDNYCDNDLDSMWSTRPWTTLTDDHVYEWKPETEAYAFLEGDYIKDGFDTWLLMIMASNEANPYGYGDFFTTELLVPVGGELEFPTGTFNITWDLGANVMIPGYMSYSGEVCFTHYGDLTTDAEGYSTAQAALWGGTVTISKVGEEYKFVFDTVDGNGNKVTGEWQGIVYVDDLRGTAPEGDDDHDHDHDHAQVRAQKMPLKARK